MTGTALTEEKEFRDIYGNGRCRDPYQPSGHSVRIWMMLYTRPRKRSSTQLWKQSKKHMQSGQPVSGWYDHY